MHRNIRRALYTALVAGGLVVVGAAAAYAAEGLPEPTTQGAPDTIEGSADARGDLDAAEDAARGDGATGNRGLVGDLVGPEGILGSLAEGDVGGVVDGALGEDGLVDDLLGGPPPTEVPGPEEPGTDGPGLEEPGQEEPGTDGPGTDPGTDDPGPVDPGIEPGTDEPGTDEPGTDEPGTDEPGTDEPGTSKPGTSKPGTSKPGTSKPGTSKPGTSKPGTGSDRPGTNLPGTGSTTVGPDGSYPDHGADRSVDVTLTDAFQSGPGGAGFGDDARIPGTNGPEDADAPAVGADRELPGGGVDISWGDNAGAHRETAYDGSFLSGDGLKAGLTGAVPEPESEPEAEARPTVVPGAADVWTGHMFTGQLSLISLLLGLGIAVLRIRRR